MMEISIHEAQTNLPALLQKVAAGEEIIIAEAGAPVAKIVSVPETNSTEPEFLGSRIPIGRDDGKGWIADDFDVLPDDLLAAFEGLPVPHRVRPGLGMDEGKVWMADDFDAPLPEDLQAYFE